MPKAPPGAKDPKPAPKKAPAKKAPAKTTVGKPVTPAFNPKLEFGGGPSMGQAYGSQDPTVDANGKPLPGTAGSPLLKGAVDPFAGTPYAGMSPYQIAQKIVNDEIQQQAQAISASMAQQNQYNQNALSVIAQLGGQLQAGAGQFATNYNNSLANMPGGGLMPGGGAPGGAPDPGKAFQGFSAGYQAAQGLISGQNPNQPGGPSQASGNGAAQQAQDAQNYTQTAIATNPFAVLPAAYGRMAQMDANLLAANQAQAMTGYSQAIQQLYAGANKDIFDEFNQIKSEFDAANGSVTAAQAQAQAQASAHAVASQKTYQWQYGQAAARAKELTSYTGEIYVVDPKTLEITPTGKLTLAAVKQGVTLQIARTLAQQAGQRLDLAKSAQANLQSYRKQTLAQKKVTAANQQAARNRLKPAPDAVSRSSGVMMLYDPASGQYVPALTSDGRTIRYKAAGGAGGANAVPKIRKAQTDAMSQASAYAQSLSTKTSGRTSQSMWVDANGNPVPVGSNGKPSGAALKAGAHRATLSGSSPAYSKQAIRTLVGRRYLPTFLRIAKQLIASGQIQNKGLSARQIADYWLLQIVPK